MNLPYSGDQTICYTDDATVLLEIVKNFNQSVFDNLLAG